MIALRIKNIRQFMNLYFMTDAFDGFTLEEGVIKTFATYNIDGLFEKGFFEEDDAGREEIDGYTPWKLIRGFCAGLIKGKRTPVYMKFVLHGDKALIDDKTDTSNIKALIIMIKFEGTGLSITTGTSCLEFSLDHDADRLWDECVRRFLTERCVEYEEM